MNRHYYGIRIKGGSGIVQEQYCSDKNRVVLGWSKINFSETFLKKTSEEIKEVLSVKYEYKNNRCLGQEAGSIYRACQIEKGDIIIVPGCQSIDVAEVTSPHLLYDNDENAAKNDIANYCAVKWLHKAYPKKQLSANLVSSCKFRQTVVALDNYKEQIDKIINDTTITSTEQKYREEQERIAREDVVRIFQHLKGRDRTKFSDNDFESFIMHLLERAFNLTGTINPKRTEFIDGRDILFTVNGLEDIQWNVQVKQHQDETNESAIKQILKGGTSPNAVNMVVSSTLFTKDAQRLADSESVVLLDGQALAELIYDEFEEIDPVYKEQLNIFKRLY